MFSNFPIRDDIVRLVSLVGRRAWWETYQVTQFCLDQIQVQMIVNLQTNWYMMKKSVEDTQEEIKRNE